MGLGRKIKELREEHNLTAKEFGKLFSLAESTISLYESDKRTPHKDIVVKIAQYFNVTTDWLYGLVENPRPEKIQKNINDMIKNLDPNYVEVAISAQEGKISPERLKKLIEALKGIDSD